jgi:hypothetical protein
LNQNFAVGLSKDERGRRRKIGTVEEGACKPEFRRSRRSDALKHGMRVGCRGQRGGFSGGLEPTYCRLTRICLHGSNAEICSVT